MILNSYREFALFLLVVVEVVTMILGSRNPRYPTTAERRWDVKPIGVVISPYINKFGTPKQATIQKDDSTLDDARIQLFPGYEECIQDLEGFDYIWYFSKNA